MAETKDYIQEEVFQPTVETELPTPETHSSTEVISLELDTFSRYEDFDCQIKNFERSGFEIGYEDGVYTATKGVMQYRLPVDAGLAKDLADAEAAVVDFYEVVEGLQEDPTPENAQRAQGAILAAIGGSSLLLSACGELDKVGGALSDAGEGVVSILSVAGTIVKYAIYIAPLALAGWAYLSKKDEFEMMSDHLKFKGDVMQRMEGVRDQLLNHGTVSQVASGDADELKAQKGLDSKVRALGDALADQLQQPRRGKNLGKLIRMNKMDAATLTDWIDGVAPQVNTLLRTMEIDDQGERGANFDEDAAKRALAQIQRKIDAMPVQQLGVSQAKLAAIVVGVILSFVLVYGGSCTGCVERTISGPSKPVPQKTEMPPPPKAATQPASAPASTQADTGGQVDAVIQSPADAGIDMPPPDEKKVEPPKYWNVDDIK